MLNVHHLSLRRKRRLFLDKVSFSLNPGEVLGVIGPSGSGKSLLAKLLLGVLDSTFQVEGTVQWMEHDLLKEIPRLREEISLVLQDPKMSLNPIMKIKHQLYEVTRNHATSVSLLEEMQLAQPQQVMEQYPFELSGGMRQRICLAMHLARPLKLLVLDEVTSALDTITQYEILQHLKNLQSKRSLAYMFITHDYQLVRAFCDRVLVLDQGQVVETGDAENILQHPQHPTTQKLVHACNL